MTTQGVQQEWLHRAAAEYRSAVVTAELLHWLLLLHASDAALAACHRIIDDELAHARLSLHVHRRAGGHEEPPPPPETARLPHDPEAPLLLRALAVAADVFCCHEGVAVPLFRAMHAEAVVAPAREALAQILKDEGRHRAFGWSLLDELLARAGPAGRVFLLPRVPVYLDQVRTAYRAPARPMGRTERAWGLQPPQAYAAAVALALRRDIEPRFQHARVLAEPHARSARHAAPKRRLSR